MENLSSFDRRVRLSCTCLQWVDIIDTNRYVVWIPKQPVDLYWFLLAGSLYIWDALAGQKFINNILNKDISNILAEKGSSSWLTALPLKEHGFWLKKQDFRDALALRYDWQLQNIPSTCICGTDFSPDHAMTCSLVDSPRSTTMSWGTLSEVWLPKCAMTWRLILYFNRWTVRFSRRGRLPLPRKLERMFVRLASGQDGRLRFSTSVFFTPAPRHTGISHSLTFASFTNVPNSCSMRNASSMSTTAPSAHWCLRLPAPQDHSVIEF